MQEETLSLTILMPCLNEAATIKECIEKAASYIESRQLQGEVLVIDNGSEDYSISIALEAGARVEYLQKKGYGNALRYGIEQARGKYIIFGDCDGSYDFSALDDFLMCLQRGDELVIGNRMHKGMKKGAMPIAHKYLGVPFLSWLGRVCCGVKIEDFHCGLRGLRREEFLKLNLRASGMEFASEMIKEAAKSGYSISQVPIILYPDKRNGRSHLRPIRDGMRHVKVLLS